MAYGGVTLGGGGLDFAPIAVTAKERPKTRPEQFGEGVEETIDFAMEFKNGAKFEGVTSYSGIKEVSKDQFRAESDKGFIEFKEKAFTYRGAIVETHKGPLSFGPYVNQQALQMDDFAQCVREGRESRVPGEMGRRDMVIVEALYEAARTGKRVAVKV
jgi:glucose-fructose oxidoreductase